jgi:hypothetical protein
MLLDALGANHVAIGSAAGITVFLVHPENNANRVLGAQSQLVKQ